MEADTNFTNSKGVEAAIHSLAAAGSAVVVPTHDPGQAAALADEALLVSRAGVITLGPVSEVMQEAVLSRLYGIPMRRIEGPDGRPHFY
ncbi:ATP-binding cassette domain-containing protein [Pseudogemmobacter bohemicus]|uniref:hypothetical protein n=1 Tax=Pseudogemmobacter bohemicus TaxID=2250708 RepID=UPI000DD2D330|nr:hypothetical protein [Pseudogemmobacter bohemicus]